MNIKKQIKTLFTFFLIALLCIASFASCKNPFTQEVIPKKYTISGELKSEVVGAVPSEYLQIENSSTDNRSAFPENPANVYYKVYAVDFADATKIVDGVVNGTTFQILLGESIWSIYAESYSDEALTKKIAQSLQYVDLTSTDKISSLTFILAPKIEATVKGYVKLAVSVEDASNIGYAEVLWNDGSDKKQKLTFTNSAKTQYFTMDSGTPVSETPVEVNAGHYTVQFNFYDSDANKNLKYSFTQPVNVYSYLTTDSWIGKAPYIDDNSSITITNLMAAYGLKNEFYVSSTGNDSNDGGFFTPFKTVAKAIDVIKSINDGTTTYNINLLSDLSADTESITTDETFGKSFISIKSDSVLKLKISSYNGSFKIDANGITTAARTIFIDANVNLTMENVTITGGKPYRKFGAGIYANTGSELVLKNKTVVKNNSVNVDGDSGAYYANGIYCAGNFTMNEGVLITENSTAMSDYVSGGGIYLAINAGGSVQITGGTISKNVSSHGAGLVINEGATARIENVSFLNNECKITGGGLWVNNDNLVVENCTFKGNKARNGGAIFVRSDLKIKNSVFDGNIAEINSGLGGNGGAIGIWRGNVEVSGSETKFLNNQAELNGAAIYCSTSENYGDSSLTISAGYFKGNAVTAGTGKGNGIYNGDFKKADLSYLISKLNLSGSVIMEADQIIYLDYLAGSPDAEQKYINLGTLTGTAATQKFKLDLGQYTGEPQVLKEYAAGGSAVSTYYGRFSLVDSNYEIKSDGKVKSAGGGIVVDGSVNSLILNSAIPESGKTYSISTETEWNYIRTIVNNKSTTCSGVTFSLGNSIALTSGNNGSIASESGSVFSGIIEGNGNEISGISGNGLIRYAKDVTINNLTVSGTLTSTYSSSSGFIGTLNSGTLIINNCINKAVYDGTGNGVGGFIGTVTDGDVLITNSENRANITTNKQTGNLGGFIGYVIAGTINVKNCINKGVITNLNATGSYAGGIIGAISASNNSKSANVINCVNIGDVSSNSCRGGISGNDGTSGGVTPLTVKYSYYYETSAVGAVNGVDVAFTKTFDLAGNFQGTILGKTNVLDALNAGITDISVLGNDGYTYKTWYKGANGYPDFVAGPDPANELVKLNAASVEALTKAEDFVGIPSAGTQLQVNTAKDAIKIIQLAQTDSLEGVNFYLSEDIDTSKFGEAGLGVGSWIPLGTSTKPFKGRIDGMGHTINIGSLENNGSDALVAYAENVHIRNLSVTGSVTSKAGTTYLAGIVGVSKGSLLLENCSSKNGGSLSCTSNPPDTIGGLVAYAETTSADDTIILRNCYNALGAQGTLTAATSYFGGIIGRIGGTSGKVIIQNCGNIGQINGVISTATYFGGILGHSSVSDTTIENCFNGNPSSLTSSTTKGSVVGYIEPDASSTASISNCFGLDYGGASIVICGTANGVDTASVGVYQISASTATIVTPAAIAGSLVTRLNDWCTSHSSTSVTYNAWSQDGSGVLKLE